MKEYNEELKNSFDELKRNLIEIFSDPFERGVLGYIDLISWLESKITNRNFSDVVDEKINRVA